MTTDKQIALIDELADKCCKWHDVHKSCMGCWRRTQGCTKFITLNKLVEEGCKLEHTGKWLNEDFPDRAANQLTVAICSACGSYAHRTSHGYSILSKYCPYCGARLTED